MKWLYREFTDDESSVGGPRGVIEAGSREQPRQQNAGEKIRRGGGGRRLDATTHVPVVSSPSFPLLREIAHPRPHGVAPNSLAKF